MAVQVTRENASALQAQLNEALSGKAVKVTASDIPGDLITHVTHVTLQVDADGLAVCLVHYIAEAPYTVSGFQTELPGKFTVEVAAGVVVIDCIGGRWTQQAEYVLR